MIEEIKELSRKARSLEGNNYVCSNRAHAIQAMAFLEAAKGALWLAEFHADRSNESDFAQHEIAPARSTTPAVEAFDDGV